MAAPFMQLRIFHRNFSRTAKDCTRTGKNLRNFRKLGKSLAVLGILELSCQGLGILELSWQGLKSTGVSVRVDESWVIGTTAVIVDSVACFQESTFSHLTLLFQEKRNRNYIKNLFSEKFSRHDLYSILFYFINASREIWELACGDMYRNVNWRLS